MTSGTNRDKDAALGFLSLLILTLTFGATLNQDWESAGLQLIYASVYSSLLAYRNHNTFSVDELLQSKASKTEPL